MSKQTGRIIKANGINLNVIEQAGVLLSCCAMAFRKAFIRGVTRSMRSPMQASMRLPLIWVVKARAIGRRRSINTDPTFSPGSCLMLDEFDAPSAVVVGHDLGATVAWQATRLRPESAFSTRHLSAIARGIAASRSCVRRPPVGNNPR